ncbi:MAG: type VI secretion system contractile sheath large subunit [Planctomycetes bacterium]|nr:type VI secretion system contractile sheath large subunit [Planctomycetota bacterium]
MGLLDEVVEGTERAAREASSRLERFLSARTTVEALRVWLDPRAGEPPPTGESVLRRLALDVARIDALLEAQVNAILHHPQFQALESAWRGLRLVVDDVPDEANQLARDIRDPRFRAKEYPYPQVMVRVLSVSWRELARDFERALEVDQSQIFHKVYSEELGSPGGWPFCALLGDYHVAHRPRPEDKVDDINVLHGMSEVAAAAFAPFFVSAHPTLLGLESFVELERPLDLARDMQPTTHPEYVRWDRFRAGEDARFVGVVLPRVLLRRPWPNDPARRDRFRFREHCRIHSEYLWGNAVYAFGTVLLRSYFDNGWLAAIRGIEAAGGGGLVDTLPECWLPSDSRGVAARGAVEVQITDTREKELSNLGLIPLCRLPGTPFSAFYSCSSAQRPARFDTPEADASSKLSAMMHYILCASRFAHYLKVMGRDATGSFVSAEQVEQLLNAWLVRYTADAEDLPEERRKEYPLAEGRAEVSEDRRKPGSYTSRFYLRPQFQIDDMATTVRLRTEIVPRGERRR